MASVVFLGALYGTQDEMKDIYIDIFMRSDFLNGNKGIAPMIAKGNKIKGIEARY